MSSRRGGPISFAAIAVTVLGLAACGSTGPSGQQGASGPSGPPGPLATHHASNFVDINCDSSFNCKKGRQYYLVAWCPVGTYVLGGGGGGFKGEPSAVTTDPSLALLLSESRTGPEPDNQEGWAVTYGFNEDAPQGGTWRVYAEAICST
jgi:hypothetical protein